jgi:signal transduction histidine kinase
MSTLRAKITALLVGAVLLVVLLATGLSVLILGPPRFEEVDDALAAQWLMVADLVPASGLQMAGPGLIGIRAEEPRGDIMDMPTEGVNAALARLGRPQRIAVYDTADAPWPVIAGRLSDGRWLVMPLTMPTGPPEGFWALARWVLIVAFGITLVLVVAVRRLTEPLALLERTVATLGPDGDLKPLDEAGPTEVRAAARAINRLSSRLKQAMESRIRLVAAAGHDLRTPMTRMRLRAEFLNDEERPNWIADLDELDRIADSAIRLVREEVDGSSKSLLQLDRLVKDVVGELREIGMDVTLTHADPACVSARPLALRRAIRNLAINAATHGVKAELRVETLEEEVNLFIEDAGPGIPEPLIARVFEPFFRVDPARGGPIPGAGLGLAIAYEIISSNDGVLELSNRPQGGLSQRVTFPMATGEIG